MTAVVPSVSCQHEEEQMSSGAVLILPAAVVVAAGAAVVVGAAAAAVLIARAANGAAEGAVRAVGAYGAKLEQDAAAQSEAEVNYARWQAVAADVVELNARIRMITERARSTGATVTVPAPLHLAGHSADQAAQWAVQAEVLLSSAQRDLYAAVAEKERTELAAGLPSAVTARRGTAAALARYQEALQNRYASPPGGRAVTGSDVDMVLGGLDPDAYEQDRLDVLRAAAAVERDDPREAQTFLIALRAKVDGVNARAARRRLAAQWLQALEEPIVARIDPPDPFLGTAEKLRAVVAGDQDLTPALHSEGAGAVEWAAEATRHQFVRELVRGCLAEQGYTVKGEFDVRHSAGLLVTRSDWHGEHSADVWVDQDGVVHGRVLREQNIRGDEAALRDRARCNAFNADLQSLATTLDAEVAVDRDHAPQRRHQEDVRETVVNARPIQREHK